MPKGDDAIRKKRNKANRKKLNREPSSVSARVAAIIAAKKRRKAGNRRMCEGMCFSLPTPDDPFNDRLGKKDSKKKEVKKLGKKDSKKKEVKKLAPSQADGRVSAKGKSSAQRKETLSKNNLKVKQRKPDVELGREPKRAKTQVIDNNGIKGSFPSKFLIQCLNSIQNALRRDDYLDREEDRSFFQNRWGIEFWKCYTTARDIVETSGSCPTVEQIAWIVSTAADAISTKEEEGLSFSSPFLLYLVPNQEAAVKVRSVCKPLKAIGIHSVSLHPGATLDHQIHGLRSCEPEFLVSTPERLLELVSMKALDISGVAFLVVDRLEAVCKGGHLDAAISIRKSILGNPVTMVFNDYPSYASASGVQNLLTGPICRLSLNDSITVQSACIIQSVHVCAFEEQKLLKGIQILHQACGDQIGRQLGKVLFVVCKGSKVQKLVTALESNGYTVSTDSTIYNTTDMENKEAKPAVSVIDTEHISTSEVGEYGLVIILDFAPSVENYVQILTGMARFTVNGILHSMMTNEDAPLAGPLIQILEQCGQAVPEPLRDLCSTSPMSEQ